MPVIFDEVIGSVEEEAPLHKTASSRAMDSAKQSSALEHELPHLRAQLQLISERAKRLRAD